MLVFFVNKINIGSILEAVTGQLSCLVPASIVFRSGLKWTAEYTPSDLGVSATSPVTFSGQTAIYTSNGPIAFSDNRPTDADTTTIEFEASPERDNYGP